MDREYTREELNITSLDSSLTQDIIYHRRRFFIRRVKAPLMKALVWGFKKRFKTARLGWLNRLMDKACLFVAVWNIMQTVNRYPEPTRENCHQPLTHALMDIWDEFFEFEDNPEHPEGYWWFGREQLFRAMKRVDLAETEHDWYYRQREHWFFMKAIEKYLNGSFPELLPMMPDRRICWKEPLDKEKILTFMEYRQYARERGKVTV